VDEHSSKVVMLPDEMGGKTIMSRLTSTDLFVSKEFFILRNASQLKKSILKEFIDYCKNPLINHCLIIVNDDFSTKASVFKQVSKIVDGINTQTPYQGKMKQWVRYFFRENGNPANTMVVEALADSAGDSLGHLSSEIDKICLWAGEGKTIEMEHLQQFSGWKREHAQWEFLSALGMKNFNKTIKIGKTIISQNETMISLMYPLTSLFQELLFVKRNGGTFQKSTGYIPLSPSIKRDLPQYAKGYSEKKIIELLRSLEKIERKQKTSTLSDESELIHFIYHAFS
jgi:DNA polymerase-3 subunit delta